MYELSLLGIQTRAVEGTNKLTGEGHMWLEVGGKWIEPQTGQFVDSQYAALYPDAVELDYNTFMQWPGGVETPS